MTLAHALLATIAIALPSVASAQNIPKGITGLYGARTETCFGTKCVGGFADTILISPLGEEYARVDISLMFQNGERCEVNKANGIWREGHLLVEMDGPPACKLHLRFFRGRVDLRDDIEAPCVQLYCGFNGSLNATLPKKGSL